MTRRRQTGVSHASALPDARGILELTAGRVEILEDIARELHGKSERRCIIVHRRVCEIVKRHDDEIECTCMPLALYFGGLA